MIRIAFVIGLGLALLVVAACSGDSVYDVTPPVAFPSASSSSSSTSSSGTSGTPLDAQVACTTRPYCGDRGCCPDGWRCIDATCVAPGIVCSSDDDCSGDRYCDPALAEPRCYPRLDRCRPDGGIPCASPCASAADLALSNAVASCSEATLYLTNKGSVTIPAGIAIELRQEDAGTAIARTEDAILPHEVTLLRATATFQPRNRATAALAADAGTPFDDCRKSNDVTLVYVSCGLPK